MFSLRPICFLLVATGFVGCASLPPEPPAKPADVSKPKPRGVTITPYEQEEIQRRQMHVIAAQNKPLQQEQQNARALPAYQNLLKHTQTAYGQKNWDEAERYALQAQRLAPQAAEIFMYLALIANQRGQYNSAESLAQRGLSYAESTPMKKILWQVILTAGQRQNQPQTVQQAQQALANL